MGNRQPFLPDNRTDLDAVLPPPRWGGILGDSLRRLWHSWSARFSLLVMAPFLLAAVAAPAMAPHDPYKMGWGHDNLPPVWVHTSLNSGDPVFLLGTDTVGRDILSRLIFGARTAVLIAIPAVLLAAALGAVIGVVSGYYGGRIDWALMRLTDVFNAFPAIMFSVLLVFILRDTALGNWAGGRPTLVFAFALIGWVPAARLIRAAVLRARSELYVEAAQSVGVPNRRILFRHILPNILSLLIVWLTTALPRVVILEALLGYIGIRLTQATQGAEFYVTSWGGMFFEGRAALHSNPTLLIAPSICVILISVAFTFLGDRLRDALDPDLRDMV